MPHSFEPGHFGPLGATREARRLWTFLNEQEQVVRLEVASELERPALEGVVVQLEDRFAADLESPRMRQLVGAMIRQVLEPRGWSVLKGGAKLKKGRSQLFGVATRYTR